ncbi:MAG: alpha-amylase family glycosyl hydrolase [Flammeovirgaceae bacterium]
MIDRFRNGEKANDDQGKGEFNPNNNDFFQGGDLKGIIEKLPYIKSLGFDALWITPPVSNQWHYPDSPIRGYHGYWTYDFMQIDPHFGTLEDFKTLVKEAHKLDIKVIQDIVLNHTGNFFTVDKALYDAKDAAKGWKPLDWSKVAQGLPQAPNDEILRMNNPTIPEHKAANIYNFTPEISDFKNREEVLNNTLAELDDINLKSPLAAKRMLDIYKFWIEEVGVDGFRIDTVIYTPEEYYEYFLYSQKEGEKGIKEFAKEKGIEDFFVFGELWTYDFELLNKYIQEGNKKRLDAVIDFPLHETLGAVFFKNAPTYHLAECLERMRLNRKLWVNFVDNHDSERMYNRSEWSNIKLALACIFTISGIPCIYYGTENGFKEYRKNMFADEYYSLQTEYAKFLQQLTHLRKQYPTLAKGEFQLDKASFNAGLLSYRMKDEVADLRILFNSATHQVFYDFEEQNVGFLEIPLDDKEKRRFKNNLILEPKSFLVLEALSATSEQQSNNLLEINILENRVFQDSEQIPLSIKVGNNEKWKEIYVLVNRNWDKKVAITDWQSGKFLLDGKHLGKGKNELILVGVDLKDEKTSSKSIVVEIKEFYRLIVEGKVPEKNLRGIFNNIMPPAEPSYQKQNYLHEVRCFEGNQYIKLEFTVGEITDKWNPPSGFDHVYFNIFFDNPQKKGKNFLPRLNYSPKNFEFNTAFVMSGWSSVAYTDENATPDSFGMRINATILQEVDKNKNLITFYFPKSSILSENQSSKGLKLFVSTWDGYLEDYRQVASTKETWNFYTEDGTDGNKMPKIFSYLELEVK